MPFMGGVEATELIRAYERHNDLPRTPIIALTAHASASISNLRTSCPLMLSLIVSAWRSRTLSGERHGKSTFKSMTSSVALLI